MGVVKSVVKPPSSILKPSVYAGCMDSDKMVSEAMCRWFESNRAHHNTDNSCIPENRLNSGFQGVFLCRNTVAMHLLAQIC